MRSKSVTRPVKHKGKVGRWIVAVILLTCTASAQTTYSTQCLEIPQNYPYFGVFRVNNRGQVLGAVGFPDECGNGYGADLRIARWESNGAIRIVEPLPSSDNPPECNSTGHLGSSNSAMNNLGQIVTTDDTNGTQYPAVYWDDVVQTVDMRSLITNTTSYIPQYP